MFSISATAAQQIQDTARSSGAHHMALRVAARVEADGSIEYGMGFDESADEDLRLDLHGVAVVIGEAHQALLEQTTLDYVELESGQFHFIFMDSQQAGAAQGDRKSGCASGGCATSACSSGGCH